MKLFALLVLALALVATAAAAVDEGAIFGFVESEETPFYKEDATLKLTPGATHQLNDHIYDSQTRTIKIRRGVFTINPNLVNLNTERTVKSYAIKGDKLEVEWQRKNVTGLLHKGAIVLLKEGNTQTIWEVISDVPKVEKDATEKHCFKTEVAVQKGRPSQVYQESNVQLYHETLGAAHDYEENGESVQMKFREQHLDEQAIELITKLENSIWRRRRKRLIDVDVDKSWSTDINVPVMDQDFGPLHVTAGIKLTPAVSVSFHSSDTTIKSMSVGLMGTATGNLQVDIKTGSFSKSWETTKVSIDLCYSIGILSLCANPWGQMSADFNVAFNVFPSATILTATATGTIGFTLSYNGGNWQSTPTRTFEWKITPTYPTGASVSATLVVTPKFGIDISGKASAAVASVAITGGPSLNLPITLTLKASIGSGDPDPLPSGCFLGLNFKFEMIFNLNIRAPYTLPWPFSDGEFFSKTWTTALITPITKQWCFINSGPTPPPPSNGDTLNENGILTDGQCLVSQDKTKKFCAQTDQNLVVYASNSPKWASNTYMRGKSPCRLIMQSDGNLVQYDANNYVLWFSNTWQKGTGPRKLIMQNDGNLVIYDSTGKALWCSNQGLLVK